MVEKEEKVKNIDDVMVFYENIRMSLKGLKEILNINLNEDDFYRQAGIDNLKALNRNILALMKHTFTPREVRIKLREIEFDELEAENTLTL